MFKETKPIPEELDKKLTNLNSSSKDDSQLGDISSINERCKWAQHCKETDNLSEKERFYYLSVINTCKNAEENSIEYLQNKNNFDREKTINKLESIRESGYRPPSCSKIKANFGDYCGGCSLGVGNPATLGRLKDKEDLKAVGFIFDDKGEIEGFNGNIFAAYLNNRLEILYTYTGRFYIYYEKRWVHLDSNFLSRICRDILHEFVPNFWTTSIESKYMEALQREVTRVAKLDSDRSKINLQNGIFDLNSYELKKHTSLIRSSIMLPINYNISAKCPVFEKFLADIFGGDEELIRVIQEMFGYCLTEETSAQKAFIFYGRGSNGKSMLAEVLMHLVGRENSSALPLAELDNPFARYELVDKVLNLATENEISDRSLNTTFFKCIVSGDPIQVEKKYEQSFMCQPFCKLVFCLNNLPYSKDKSWGFQRRLVIIPFNKVFREDDPSTQNYGELKESLMSEIDGIFNWALEGLRRLRANNYKFSKSTAIKEALEDYKDEVNPYHSFAKEKLEQGEDNDSITNETLANMFKEWAAKAGHKTLATASNQKIVKEIRNVLKDLGTKINYGNQVKIGGKRCTQGVRKNKGESVFSESVA